MTAKSAKTFRLLRRFESPNVTFIEPGGSWPIVWERAKGTRVWDLDGKEYVDFTAAFGVAAAGHSNARVVAAGTRQMGKLLHAMGDVHPHELKGQLARELSRLTFERWGRTGRRTTGKAIFCNSGFEAVEAALKTVLLATKRPGLIAFDGAYHGTGYGALNATHREHFRKPFLGQLGGFGAFLPFPSKPSDLASLEQQLRGHMRRRRIGAVLLEPIQVRGGIRIPPRGFLPMLRRVCDQERALLILDEIYTGFGRTGRWFACEHSWTTPDLICLGKALTGGFPLSVCLGRADLMDAAWPPSTGEAIHTSTFLGHPVGCAMALAQMKEIQRRDLVNRSTAQGAVLLAALRELQAPNAYRLEARGLGLLVGLEIRDLDARPATAFALQVVKRLLHSGFIVLPEGEHSNVIGFTPPLTITGSEVQRMVGALQQVLLETRQLHARNKAG